MSTDHQQLAAQEDALAGAGCTRVFTDRMSGVREDRPGLVALLDFVRAGDTVVVVALDRLGRSLSGVIRTVERLTEAGVLLRSLREGIDYGTPTGRMLAGIFASLAAYERELMHERAAAAREAARLRGRHTGRPPRLGPDQVRQLRALRAGGESIGGLMKTFGVSRATVYRALPDTGPEPVLSGAATVSRVPVVASVGVPAADAGARLDPDAGGRPAAGPVNGPVEGPVEGLVEGPVEGLVGGPARRPVVPVVPVAPVAPVVFIGEGE